MTDIRAKVRALCLAMPEVEEKVSHGAPAFFANKQFAHVWVDGHHDNHFPHLWCAAPPGAQGELIAASNRFFRPPYVGHRGWVGLRLDGKPDWTEVGEVLEDAYRTVAPKRLVALLDR